MNIKLTIFFMFIVLVNVIHSEASAKPPYQLADERRGITVYSDWTCENVVDGMVAGLQDGSRPGCINATLVFSYAWANSAGLKHCILKSQHYAQLIPRKPACALIVRNEKEWNYYHSIANFLHTVEVQPYYVLAGIIDLYIELEKNKPLPGATL